MVQEVINIGGNPNDGSGDPLRSSFYKINNNFSQLFSLSVGADAHFNANSVVTTNTNSNLNLQPNGGGSVVLGSFNQLYIPNTTASTSSTTGALIVTGGIGAASGGFNTITATTVTASSFVGSLTGTASLATVATTATYATTSGLATNAINYAGSQLPNVTAVGSLITTDNTGNVTVQGNLKAYRVIGTLSVMNVVSYPSATVPTNTQHIVLDSANGNSVSSSVTITLPANANLFVGQRITLSSNCTISTLTVTAGSGTKINGAPTSINNTTSYSWVLYQPPYDSATWVRA